MNESKVDTVPVIVTGIGGGGHGEQILKALRLAETRYKIIGTDVNPECANKNEADVFHVAPPARDAGYLDYLIGLGKKYGCVALFHGSEPEMMVMSEARDLLQSEGLYTPVNPASVMEICQDKARTSQYLSEGGFAHPAYKEISSRSDLKAFNHFPCVLKPSVGGGGSANVFIVQNAGELELFGEYMLKLYKSFLAQEYIGSYEGEFTVGVLFGQDGALLNSIAIKRIINNALTIRTKVPNVTGREELGRNLIVSTGISQGIVGHWPEVTAQCEKLATGLNPIAPVNIQCRVVDGQVIPFEINPRFSGTTSLRAMAGYNEPDTLIRRDVLGQNIESHFSYRSMTILRGLKENIVAAEAHKQSENNE